MLSGKTPPRHSHRAGGTWRNFFKVELWTMDGLRVDLLFAGGSLDKARALFTAYGEKADSEVPEVRPTSIFLRQHD
jgi:hypothetical protein